MSLRRQLTLFVPAPSREGLEAWRQRLDPVQHGLIAAHVTLCREDELAGHDETRLRERVRAWSGGAITLDWHPAERFDGHGVLLRAAKGLDAFQALRVQLLANPAARPHAAHLTLAHPRNPPAAGQWLDALAALPAFPPVRFDAVSLIEQDNATPWRTCWSERLSP